MRNVLNFGITDNWRTANRYGRTAWCVGLPDGREAHVSADSMTIDAGVLTFWSESMNRAPNPLTDEPQREPCDPCPVLTLAPGAWTGAYAASVFDGSPVAVGYLPSPRKRDDEEDDLDQYVADLDDLEHEDVA